MWCWWQFLRQCLSPPDVSFLVMPPFCVWFDGFRIKRKAIVALCGIFLQYSKLIGTQGTTKDKEISGECIGEDFEGIDPFFWKILSFDRERAAVPNCFQSLEYLKTFCRSAFFASVYFCFDFGPWRKAFGNRRDLGHLAALIAFTSRNR